MVMLAPVSTRFPLMVSAVALLLGAGASSAQTRVFVAGGAMVPLGDFASVAEPGPGVGAGVLLGAGTRGLVMGVDASYARGSHSSGDARSDVYGLTGLIGYTLGGLGAVELTPLLGAGALVHTRRSAALPGLDATRAGPGASLGLRATFPVGGGRAFAAGGYVLGFGDVNTAAFPTKLLSLTAGVTISLGR
jgi:hypothetical protein